MAKALVKIDLKLGDFDKQIRRVAKNLIPEAALNLQKLVALQILKRVVELNPVGNPTQWKGGRASAPKGYVGGRSRANWQIGMFPNTKEVPIGRQAEIVGAAEIANINVPYGSIWLFNNVPYIEALELGHSKQAPAGMLRIAIAEAAAGLRTL